MSRIIIAFIRLYQYCLSPFLGPSCRFSPSCSHYACEALARHGVARGLILSVWRIMRCNPWSRGGYDPVPVESSR
ncbi:MAG: membrane protein insertion efficiency factor YidD [Nitrosospira multiformis]|nr:membrane protein insertion efficiency factor YidD [Nitrosospira multiformis]